MFTDHFGPCICVFIDVLTLKCPMLLSLPCSEYIYVRTQFTVKEGFMSLSVFRFLLVMGVVCLDLIL